MPRYQTPDDLSLVSGCARDVLIQGAPGGFVPDDGADLPTFAPQGTAADGHARAFEVGTAGDVRITTLDGGVRTIPVVPGRLYPVGVVRVHASGTTADGILLYI